MMISRIGIPVVLAALAAIAWIAFHDDASSPGTAVIGAYRDRWFLASSLLTYVALWVVALSLTRLSTGARLRVLVSHVALLISIVALEVLAVLGLVDFSVLLGNDRDKRSTLVDGVRLTGMGRPNAVYEGTVHPDLVGVLGARAEPVPFRIVKDGYGLRNAQHKDSPRVVCLGDSVLVASLVRAEQIVTEQLERELQLSVLNVSEVAYSPQEAWLRFKSTGLAVEGRIFVQFIFAGNDLADSASWRARHSRSSSSNWPDSGLVKTVLSWLHSPKLAAGRRRMATFRGVQDPPTEVHFLYDASMESDAITEFPNLADDLRRTERAVREQGGRYAIALIPSKLTVLQSFCEWPPDTDLAETAMALGPFAGALRDLCETERIPFLDLTPPLRASAAIGEMPFYAADTHLNARGHTVMTEALVPWLRGILHN